jgi:hypothetical protein
VREEEDHDEAHYDDSVRERDDDDVGSRQSAGWRKRLMSRREIGSRNRQLRRKPGAEQDLQDRDDAGDYGRRGVGVQP